MKTYETRFIKSLANRIDRLVFLILLIAPLSFPFVGQAAEFPDRPISLIVPMAAGDQADIACRPLAKAAETILRQPIAVMNRPGGGGTNGIASIAGAKPDGYTIGVTLTSPMVTLPHFIKLTYHPIKDIQPIMQFGILRFAVSVKGDSPFKTFKDLIAYAREHPGTVTYGTTGPNNTQYILIEQIAKQEKVVLVNVPFKGGAENFSAAVGGHITASAGNFIPAQVRAKKARLLALFSDERLEEFPDIPTLGELGYKIAVPYFAGIGAPKGVPEPILKKLEQAFSEGMKDPAFIQGMRSIEMPIKYRNSSDFTRFLSDGYEAMGKYIDELGLKKK